MQKYGQADFLLFEVAAILIPTVGIALVILIASVLKIKHLSRKLDRFRRLQFLEIEKDRKQIANDLHDYVGGKLVVIKQELKESFDTINDVELLKLVSKINDDIVRFHNEIRLVVEYIYPKELMLSNLKGSFESLGAEMSTEYTRIIVDVEFDKELSNMQLHQLFRLAQETVSNLIFYREPKSIIVGLYENETGDKGILSFSYQITGEIKSKLAKKLINKGGRGQFVIKERTKLLDAKLTWERSDDLFVEQFEFPIQLKK